MTSSLPSLSRNLEQSLNCSLYIDDKENTVATVAHFVEHLHANVSTAYEKELITARLLGLARARKDARNAVGSHTQAMPLFVSVLRNGTPNAKGNVAAILSALCKDEDLRMKVLLGGCVPPLLSLLRSEATNARRAAAEAIYEVSSGSLSDDHVGTKIFVTEGVVPALWEQLNPKIKRDKAVAGFVAGALRNLCGEKDGYWHAALEAGGVDIILGLLTSDSTFSQSNAASLLARLITVFHDSIQKVADSGAITILLSLLDQGHDLSVRVSAANALESLTSKSVSARHAVVVANGVPVLLRAVVSPSKQCTKDKLGETLQHHSVSTLANVYGGISKLIIYLGELCQSPRLLAPVADIIGALAYSLMIYEVPAQVEPFVATKIEGILASLLKPRDNKHMQQYVLEALFSLYNNKCLCGYIDNAKAKNILIGLVTLASSDTQDELISAFINICCDRLHIWEAIKEREGIQLLISLLGLSSEHHQEYAVALLAVLTNKVDDSKWAITAAGGIPPLVQLLESGSQRAREGAAHVLWNLCCYSADICACIESAAAVPALICLLKTGGYKGQEAAARTLIKLIHSENSSIINQLLALLLGEIPSMKYHIISVLGHVLTLALYDDLVKDGATANKGLKSLVHILNSSNGETQEHAACILADLLSTRQDVCGSFAIDEIIHPCMKLLTSDAQMIAAQSARVLTALSRPLIAKTSGNMLYIADGDVKPLIRLAKTSATDAAETAVAALANLLSDPKVAREALVEDIVSALARVLKEGTLEGKRSVSRVLWKLLSHFAASDVLTDGSQSTYIILSLVDSLNSVEVDEASEWTDVLDVLVLLAKIKLGSNSVCASWMTSPELASNLGPLIQFLADGQARVQDKAVEILSQLCKDQSAALADLLVGKHGCVPALANRILNSSSLEVQIGGTVLLICAIKGYKQEAVNALNEFEVLKPLICFLVEMVKHSGSSKSNMFSPHTLGEKNSYAFQADEIWVPDSAVFLGETVALWLLLLISSSHERYRTIVVETHVIEALCETYESYSTCTAELGAVPKLLSVYR